MRSLLPSIILTMSLFCLQAQEADTSFNLLSVADPQVRAKTYNLGLERLQEGSFREAITLLADVVAVPEFSADASFAIAICQYQSGDYEEALTTLSDLVQKELRADYAYLAGLCHSRLGHWADAETELSRCLGIDPNYTEAYFVRATVRHQAGEDKLAVRDLSAFTELDSTRVDAWYLLAWLYYRSGQYEQAMGPATKALDLAEGQQSARLAEGDAEFAGKYNDIKYLHCLLLEGTGKRDMAMRELAILTNSDAFYHPAFNELALMLAAGGKFREAESVMSQIADTEAVGLYRSNYGYLLYSLQRYEDARKYFDEAIGIDETNPTIWFNRGACREMLRDHHGACEDWQRAADLGMEEARPIIEKQCK